MYSLFLLLGCVEADERLLNNSVRQTGDHIPPPRVHFLLVPRNYDKGRKPALYCWDMDSPHCQAIAKKSQERYDCAEGTDVIIYIYFYLADVCRFVQNKVWETYVLWRSQPSINAARLTFQCMQHWSRSYTTSFKTSKNLRRLLCSNQKV